MRKLFDISCILVIMAALLSACQPWYKREPLEVMEPQAVRFRLDVDWERLFGEVPSGMTVMLFADKQPGAVTTVSHEVKSRYLDLLPDKYRLVLFNKSAGDFPSMQFENMDSYAAMRTRANTFTPSHYTDWTQGQKFTYNPEHFGTVIEEFEITEEMLYTQVTFYPYKEWIKMKTSENASTRFYQEDDLTYVMEVAPEPREVTLFVRVHITNSRNLKSVEGYITGFADGWHITGGHPAEGDETRYLLDNWTVTDDSEHLGDGWAVASTTLWGEPYGKEYWEDRADDQHVLKMRLTLYDGSTIDYEYNVGKDVRFATNVWGEEWSYTNNPTDIEVLTIWDRDPGNTPGKPDDPDVITPDGPKQPDDPDNPREPENPKDPREPVLPDVEGKDQSGKSGWGVDVDPWVDGGRVEIPI